MRIVCDQCHAEFNVDDSRIPTSGLDIKCPRCLSPLHIDAPMIGSETIVPGDVPILSDRWFLLRPSGKIYGPFDAGELTSMASEGNLSGNEHVSQDKASWKLVRDVQPFAGALPADVAAAASNAPGRVMQTQPLHVGAFAAPDFGADARLPGTGGETDLPQPAAPGTDSLQPVGGGKGAELPAPAGFGGSVEGRTRSALDLAGPGAGPMNPLASPFDNAPLPQPASPGIDLPAPALGTPDLPTPNRSGADLPQPAGGGPTDLPRPQGSAIPDLPKPTADPFASPLDGLGAGSGLDAQFGGAAAAMDLGNMPDLPLPDFSETGDHTTNEVFADADVDAIFGQAPAAEPAAAPTAGSKPPKAPKPPRKPPSKGLLGALAAVVLIAGGGAALSLTDMGPFGINLIGGGDETPTRGTRSAAKPDEPTAVAATAAKAAEPAPAAGTTEDDGTDAEPDPTGEEDPADDGDAAAASDAPKRELPSLAGDPTTLPSDSWIGYEQTVEALTKLGSGDVGDHNRARAALARALQGLRYGSSKKLVSEIDGRLKRAGGADDTVDYKLVEPTISILQGGFDRALEDIADVLEDSPKHPIALVLQGEAHIGKGDLDAAEASFRAAVEAQPNASCTNFSLGSLLALRAGADGLKRKLGQAMSKEAEARLETAWKAEEAHLLAAIELAKLQVHSNPASALETLDLATDPNVEIGPPEHKARAHYVRALAHQALDQHDEATAQFEAALRLAKRNKRIRSGLAAHFAQRRQWEKARKQYVTLTKIGDKSADTMAALIDAEIRLGLLRDARKHIDEATREFEKDARFLYLRGRADDADRELPQALVNARKAYEAAIEMDDDLLEAHVALAMLQIEAKEWKKAEAALTKLTKRHKKSALLHTGIGRIRTSRKKNKEAVASFSKALSLDEDFTDARLELAQLLRESGDADTAFKELNVLKDKGIDSVEMHFQLAQTQQALKNPDAALAAYDVVLSRDSTVASYAFKAGTAYLDKNDYETARTNFQKALQIDGDMHAAHFFIGMTYLKQNNYEEASKRFQVAADEDRQNLQYRYYLGLAHMKQGSLKEAREMFAILNDELKRDPKRRKEIPDLYYQQGLLFFRQGKWARALGYFKEGLGAHEERSDPWFKAAECLSELSYYKQAIPLYKQAIRRDKKFGDAYYKLALAYMRQKTPDQAKAVDNCRQAIKLEAGVCECELTLAYVERDRRNRKRAIAAFKSYLEKCGKSLGDKERYDLESELKMLVNQRKVRKR